MYVSRNYLGTLGYVLKCTMFVLYVRKYAAEIQKDHSLYVPVRMQAKHRPWDDQGLDIHHLGTKR